MTRERTAPRLGEVLERLSGFYGPLPDPPREPYPHFLWQILSLHASTQGRDAAFLALRRIPALTPDAVARAAPARIEAALLLAGPHSPDRRRLLTAGTEVFRRRRDLDAALRGPFLHARRAFTWLGPLNPAVSQWLLLFCGDHPVLPLDPRICRVGWRLGWGEARQPVRLWQRQARHALAVEAGGDLPTLRRVAQSFSHHADSACSETAPRCGVCPVAVLCARGGESGSHPR